MNRAAAITKGLAALVLLAVLAAGIPWALWHFVGWPLPHRLPGWHQLSTDLTQHGIADTTLLKALACVVWIAWAVLIASLAVEIPATIRGRAARIAVGGPLQPLVAQLLAAVAIAALSLTPRPANSGPQTLAVGLGVGRASRPVAAVALAADSPPTSITTTALVDTTPPRLATPEVQVRRGYVVQRNDTLWGIAERELGDPLRWRDIYALNQDRPQPGRTRLVDPHWIDPGWTLLLPEAGPAPAGETPTSATTSPTRDDASPGTTPAVPPTNSDSSDLYTVVPGDSLWKIADARLGAGGDWPSLWAANRDRPEPAGAALVDPSLVRPGWQLTIPADGAVDHVPANPLDPDPVPAPPTPTGPITTSPTPDGSHPSTDGRPAPVTQPWRPGIELPGGYVVAAALATAAGAALGAARLHRRRRRVPSDPTPAIAFEDPLNEPTVCRLAVQRDQYDRPGEAMLPIQQPPPPGVVAIGRYATEELSLDLHGGVCLLGDDSLVEVARAAVLSLLSHPPHDAHVVIAGRELAAQLLGESCDLPGLTIADDLPGALRRAEVELVSRNRILEQLEVPDADALARSYPEERFAATIIVAAKPADQQAGRVGAVLSAGRHLALGALLLGAGPAEATIEIGPDRQLVSAAPAGHHLATTSGAQLYGISAAEAAEIVATLAAGRGVIPDAEILPEVPFAAPGQAPRAAFEVTVLGGCRIYARNGVEVTGLREKAKELLAYLLLNPDGVPADRAMETLWPEVDPRRGRDRFRTVLSNLRGQLADALGESGFVAVERIGPICRVDPAGVECDLWRFEAALGDARSASTPEEKRAAYARAGEAYGGDLLDGADCLWVEAPREKLRDLAVGALCRLADLAQAADAADAAVAALERAVDLDPYGEETARRLIALQGQVGDLDAARRVYRRLSRVLQHDLDVDPSPETRAMLEEILRRSADRGRAAESSDRPVIQHS